MQALGKTGGCQSGAPYSSALLCSSEEKCFVTMTQVPNVIKLFEAVIYQRNLSTLGQAHGFIIKLDLTGKACQGQTLWLTANI